MLLAYPKNEQDNLTASQIKILKSLVESSMQKSSHTKGRL